MGIRNSAWPKSIAEWLVLGACVVIIAGLVLPWSLNTRISSRRAVCLNNLRNLALACNNFETTQKAFPGYQQTFGARDPESADGKIGSWVVSLLHLIEMQPLRDEWDNPASNASWQSLFDGSQQPSSFYPEISLLRCPADITSASMASLSYVANTGFYPVTNDSVFELDAYTAANSDSQRISIAQRSANGIFNNQLPPVVLDPISGRRLRTFAPAEQVSLGDLRDGTSQTILFSENAHRLSWKDFSIADDRARLKVGIVWLYAGESAEGGRPTPAKVTPQMSMTPDHNPEMGVTAATARPSSHHPGVIQCAFADGAVSNVDTSIDYRIYQALMTPNGQSSDAPHPTYILKDDDFRQ